MILWLWKPFYFCRSLFSKHIDGILMSAAAHTSVWCVCSWGRLVALHFDVVNEGQHPQGWLHAFIMEVFLRVGSSPCSDTGPPLYPLNPASSPLGFGPNEQEVDLMDLTSEEILLDVSCAPCTSHSCGHTFCSLQTFPLLISETKVLLSPDVWLVSLPGLVEHVSITFRQSIFFHVWLRFLGHVAELFVRTAQSCGTQGSWKTKLHCFYRPSKGRKNYSHTTVN